MSGDAVTLRDLLADINRQARESVNTLLSATLTRDMSREVRENRAEIQQLRKSLLLRTRLNSGLVLAVAIMSYGNHYTSQLDFSADILDLRQTNRFDKEKTSALDERVNSLEARLNALGSDDEQTIGARRRVRRRTRLRDADDSEIEGA